MFDVTGEDLMPASTQESIRKPTLEDASRRARALLGSLKEKRDFFATKIHVAHSNIQDVGDQVNLSNAHCPSPTRSSLSYSDMTTTLGSKIQDRRSMLSRLTSSPNGSYRTANTQETTASTLTTPVLEEATVIGRIPPAPSLKDIEDSIKDDVCVVIPIRDQSPSPELSTSWLEDSSDTPQQCPQTVDSNINSCSGNLPTAIFSPQVACERYPHKVVEPPHTNLCPLSIPPQASIRAVDYPDRTTPCNTAGSDKHTATIRATAVTAHEMSAAKMESATNDRTLRNNEQQKEQRDRESLPRTDKVLNHRSQLHKTNDTRRETSKTFDKPPRPSRRNSRNKRTVKDRRKTEMALSAASLLLEPASSFEDHSDTYPQYSFFKSAAFPISDLVDSGMKRPAMKEKSKTERPAKHGLKVSSFGSQPNRSVKESDPLPTKVRRRSVTFALPDERKTPDRYPVSSVAESPAKNHAVESQNDYEKIHFISQKDAEMVPNGESLKEEIPECRTEEKGPVVLVQYSEDSQEDRSAFLKPALTAHGYLKPLRLKKDVKRISVRVDRFGILRKRCSNASDDSSMDSTTDSNTSGWMSGSDSLDGASSNAVIEDISDIDVIIKKKNPRAVSPLLSAEASKQRVVYSAKLVSSPVPARIEENEPVSGDVLLPELDDRCSRKNRYKVPILLRPLVFASENQSDALSQCYGGMYSISSESIVEKRIQAFERKIKAGQYVPQYQPISKDFPCATRGSLYDIAVHSGCVMDEEKLKPRPETRRKENPAKGGLYYLALSSGLSRSSIESRCSYTIFTKTSACSVIESNGEVIAEEVSDEMCGACGSLYIANTTVSLG
ncbi:hypothetical protein FisN_2Lh157 [Fistulifera solaris]|uniref:Uncharacterized protein n=1 Tax=Fistulifera solaris TaxID=1519565 RepID=A0A1Z5KFA0_FISSO|nr:hypothetical protein FisN_2Lh157 [Fistulifera solaris]|eukprot:GAX24886.1 hypothetical protein FisN_2Lh157 [Fistulifera solaris]